MVLGIREICEALETREFREVLEICGFGNLGGFGNLSFTVLGEGMVLGVRVVRLVLESRWCWSLGDAGSSVVLESQWCWSLGGAE